MSGFGIGIRSWNQICRLEYILFFAFGTETWNEEEEEGHPYAYPMGGQSLFRWTRIVMFTPQL
jgi:hypothetical protein